MSFPMDTLLLRNLKILILTGPVPPADDVVSLMSKTEIVLMMID